MKSKELTHEGFPLLLRYPEKVDFDFHKDVFPNLEVITHEFSKVDSNGLPNPEYNDSLFQFDSDNYSAEVFFPYKLIDNQIIYEDEIAAPSSPHP